MFTCIGAMEGTCLTEQLPGLIARDSDPLSLGEGLNADVTNRRSDSEKWHPCPGGGSDL